MSGELDGARKLECLSRINITSSSLIHHEMKGIEIFINELIVKWHP